MKNLLLVFLISIGLFSSCVEAPYEDPDTVPDEISLTADFNNQTFESTTTTAVINTLGMTLKATKADGSYFRIKLPGEIIAGTYDLETLEGNTTGFSIEYNEGDGTESYIAPFQQYTDPVEVVILGIDRVNKRISGTFRFTGIRYADATETATESIVFTNGVFLNIPYTETTPVTPTEDILPSRIVKSYPNQSIDDETTIYTYLDKKIVKEIFINSSGVTTTTNYTYNNVGDLITKIEIKIADVLVTTKDFEYDANAKLISYLESNIAEDTAVKETYSYNSSGSIDVARFTVDSTGQETEDGTSTINFSSGEIASIVFSSGTTKSYTYDNKNYAFKNVIGFDKISFVDGEATGITKNIINETINNLPVNTFEFTYTTADFPLKRTDIGVEVNYFYD